MAGSGPVPGIQIPTTAVAGGTTYNTTGLLNGHIFNNGAEKPDVLSALIIKYPEYYLTSLLEKIGATQEIDNNTLSWNVMGRTRKGATISSISNGTTATVTCVLDTTYDAATGNLGYFLVGDTVRVAESEEIGRITAVSNSGGTVQTIDMVKYGGGNWATSTVLGGWHIGHIGSMYGEGSTGAGGYRNYFPDADYNVTTILRRDFKISRDAMKSKKWIDAPGGKNWWYAQEDFEQREIMRDVEATLLCGKRYKSASLQGANLSRGLFEYATGSGVTSTFSSSVGVQEADWSNLLTQLSDQQGSNEVIALCGTQILADSQHAFADRYRSIPNSEKPASIAGLGFQSYELLGKRVHLAKYEAFSDTSIFPAVAATSTVKDPRNLALILDFSQTENGTNIQLKYRNGAKMIQKMIPGMASEGLEVASKFDGIEGALLTEFMPVCYLPNRLGILYSNS